MSSLTPDREMLAQFAGLMFKHARPDGFVSLRAFPDKGSKKDEARSDIESDPDRRYATFLDITVERARRRPTWHEPAVFCPPVATFRTTGTQRPTTSAKGVCLCVECDQRPLEARQTLEALLGTATAVVAVRRRMDKPRDRRDRAESASALAAEKADIHKGGA